MPFWHKKKEKIKIQKMETKWNHWPEWGAVSFGEKRRVFESGENMDNNSEVTTGGDPSSSESESTDKTKKKFEDKAMDIFRGRGRISSSIKGRFLTTEQFRLGVGKERDLLNLIDSEVEKNMSIKQNIYASFRSTLNNFEGSAKEKYAQLKARERKLKELTKNLKEKRQKKEEKKKGYEDLGKHRGEISLIFNPVEKMQAVGQSLGEAAATVDSTVKDYTYGGLGKINRWRKNKLQDNDFETVDNDGFAVGKVLRDTMSATKNLLNKTEIQIGKYDKSMEEERSKGKEIINKRAKFLNITSDDLTTKLSSYFESSDVGKIRNERWKQEVRNGRFRKNTSDYEALLKSEKGSEINSVLHQHGVTTYQDHDDIEILKEQLEIIITQRNKSVYGDVEKKLNDDVTSGDLPKEKYVIMANRLFGDLSAISSATLVDIQEKKKEEEEKKKEREEEKNTKTAKEIQNLFTRTDGEQLGEGMLCKLSVEGTTFMANGKVDNSLWEVTGVKRDYDASQVKKFTLRNETTKHTITVDLENKKGYLQKDEDQKNQEKLYKLSIDKNSISKKAS